MTDAHPSPATIKPIIDGMFRKFIGRIINDELIADMKRELGAHMPVPHSLSLGADSQPIVTVGDTEYRLTPGIGRP